jgi:hypothetical protein
MWKLGASGVVFNELPNLDFKDLIKIWGETNFNVSEVANKIDVSTKITDEYDNIIAEIRHNEWKSAPTQSGLSWDKNYSNNALEVQDSKGHIVLQVKIFMNLVQIQGAWWINFKGQRVQMVLRETPKDDEHYRQFRAQMLMHSPSQPWPEIQPMFVYPSDFHLHELRQP